MLEAAQRIAGVSFTREEQQAILARLNATTGYIAGSAFLRAASLGDSTQPAIVFNPGLHMTGKLFGEPELFLLAHAFQSKTDHHLKHPVLQ